MRTVWFLCTRLAKCIDRTHPRAASTEQTHVGEKHVTDTTEPYSSGDQLKMVQRLTGTR